MGDADRANVDDDVAYSYDISNNGTTTMSDVEISDNNVRTSQYRVNRNIMACLLVNSLTGTCFYGWCLKECTIVLLFLELARLASVCSRNLFSQSREYVPPRAYPKTVNASSV